jgi:hypothetical protein
MDAIRAQRERTGCNVRWRERGGDWQTFSFRSAVRAVDFLRRVRLNGHEGYIPDCGES